jgi:hypothetical protein
VSPFNNAFVVLPHVPYRDGKIVLDWLNTGRFGYIAQDDGEYPCGQKWQQSMQDTWEQYSNQRTFQIDAAPEGYVTHDGNLESTANIDFGSDGDDTVHSPIPQHRIPFYVQSTLIPSDLQDDDVVDLIFTNFSSWGVWVCCMC